MQPPMPEQHGGGGKFNDSRNPAILRECKNRMCDEDKGRDQRGDIGHTCIHFRNLSGVERWPAGGSITANLPQPDASR